MVFRWTKCMQKREENHNTDIQDKVKCENIRLYNIVDLTPVTRILSFIRFTYESQPLDYHIC